MSSVLPGFNDFQARLQSLKVYFVWVFLLFILHTTGLIKPSWQLENHEH